VPRGENLSPGGGEQESVRPRPPVSAALRHLYNLVFLLGLLGYLPLLFWRMLVDPTYRQGIGQRSGRVPPSPKGRPVVWVHGVSVGEVKAAVPLVESLRRKFPELLVRISATTPTGAKVARKIFGEDRVFLFPLDFGGFPGRSLDRVRPICLILVELELWPNILLAAEKRGVPVAVVNGRISERSFKGYRFVHRLLPQLDRIDVFCVQNRTYADRLERLGVAEDRILITGNLKYDGLEIPADPPAPDPEFWRVLGIREGETILVCGSIHPGEELPLARAALALERRSKARFRLILVPRHPEKSPGILRRLRRVLRKETGSGSQHRVRRWTERRPTETLPPGTWLLLDTIGDLARAYSLADLVFVGGSFVHHGGQNMLEPVALHKPTLFGPHVWNFQVDVDLLLEGEGVRMVRDEGELEEALLFLYGNPSEASAMAERGVSVLRRHRGATARTLERLLPILRRGEGAPGGQGVLRGGSGGR